jgi:hypothetical protein
MASRFDDLYRFKSDTVLTDDEFNKRFKDLDSRLTSAEIARLSENDAFGIVLDRVLGRSEAVISSLRDQLLSITQLDWLTASSVTAQVLVVGGQLVFTIVAADRALFAPGPFAVLSWGGGEPTDYAVVRSISFDRGLGLWSVQVEAFVGDAGPHADWQIAAIAGSTLAQLALLQSGQAAADATHADRLDVDAMHAEVLSAKADVVALAGDAQGAGSFDDRITALEGRAAATEAAVATIKSRNFFFNGW